MKTAACGCVRFNFLFSWRVHRASSVAVCILALAQTYLFLLQVSKSKKSLLRKFVSLFHICKVWAVIGWYKKDQKKILSGWEKSNMRSGSIKVVMSRVYSAHTKTWIQFSTWYPAKLSFTVSSPKIKQFQTYCRIGDQTPLYDLRMHRTLVCLLIKRQSKAINADLFFQLCRIHSFRNKFKPSSFECEYTERVQVNPVYCFRRSLQCVVSAEKHSDSPKIKVCLTSVYNDVWLHRGDDWILA